MPMTRMVWQVQAMLTQADKGTTLITQEMAGAQGLMKRAPKRPACMHGCRLAHL